MPKTIACSSGGRGARGWLAASMLAAASLIAATAAPDADACGGFFLRRATTTTPSLRVEQVLIVHDPDKEEEHFIRELVFRDAKEPFGFVVPVPSRPTVAKVEGSPFRVLAEVFPPEPASGIGLGSIGLLGHGSGRGAAGPGVTVISEERIGSFTAFVLAATDAAALTKWLDENQLATTPQSQAWLAHYTALGFHFVAFRHEPPADGKKGPSARSETVRISFSTPLPYYPYLEPDHPGEPPKLPRVLAVWLLSTRRSVPVAARREGAQVEWIRPWEEARRFDDPTLSSLGKALPQPLLDLLPAGSSDPPIAGAPVEAADPGARHLVLQTFEDQKMHRQGWGDVVLVPESPAPINAARAARLGKLMAALDPAHQEKP